MPLLASKSVYINRSNMCFMCVYVTVIRIPLMCIPISDWFTAAHMTYYNFTVRP